MAKLPPKFDRKVLRSTIEAADPRVHACASKHGQQGAREVFYFRLDGPSGKVLSVRASYGPKGFRKCAEAVYRGLAFTRVQESEIKYTHHIQL